MSLDKTLIQAIIERTLTVPKVGICYDPDGDGTANVLKQSEKYSRQLDIALMSAGFKADSDVLEYISCLTKVDAANLVAETVRAVQTLVGDHVKHNVYFKNFPEDVPDTVEFWTELVEKTYGQDGAEFWDGNLLELDGYGKYQHSYEEMLKAHQPLMLKSKRKLKRIKLGKTFQTEVNKLFISLAESAVPLNSGDKDLLAKLASVSVKKPVNIPVRENKAIINSVYIEEDTPLLIDTISDVLRLAAYLSGGDVTLQTPTKYKKFTGKQRRALIDSFSKVSEAKLADAKKNSYREQVKRLVTHLHAAKHKAAKQALHVANGKKAAQTFEGKIEQAFTNGDVKAVITALEKTPGLLLRSLNRLLMASKIRDLARVYVAVEKALEKSSTRVLVSLRQYIENRNTDKIGRVFVNKKGGTYLLQEVLDKLPENVIKDLKEMLDKHIAGRMEETQIVVDKEIRHYALPISDRDRAQGLNVIPRGTEVSLDPEAQVLRFFTYWKQKNYTTDFDLSVILLDENFEQAGQLSYTNLSTMGGVHSGDITSAPSGASEFIDIELDKVGAKYIIPQVNIYNGETFDEVEEGFFGYMLRSYEEKGKPFEAKTVETKSDLYGTNKIALPMVFIKTDEGWKVKQLNLFLKGHPRFNATENNASQTQVLLQSIVNEKYLTMEYLASKVDLRMPLMEDGEVIDGAPYKEITHTNLHEVIPE